MINCATKENTGSCSVQLLRPIFFWRNVHKQQFHFSSLQRLVILFEIKKPKCRPKTWKFSKAAEVLTRFGECITLLAGKIFFDPTYKSRVFPFSKRHQKPCIHIHCLIYCNILIIKNQCLWLWRSAWCLMCTQKTQVHKKKNVALLNVLFMFIHYNVMFFDKSWLH